MKKYTPIIVLAILVILVMITSVTELINEFVGISIALGLVIILNLSVAVVALKHKLKAVSFIMFFFMVLGITLLTLNIYSYYKKEDKSSEFLLTVETHESPKTKIFTHESKNYYTYNIDKIEVEFKGETKKYSLEEALNQKRLSLENILKLSIPNDQTEGYKIFYNGGNSGLRDSYSIIMCENNDDVIFSTFNYIYTEDICY